MTTSRRQFLSTATTTLFGTGLVFGLIACGGDDAGDPTDPEGGVDSCGADISGNHGHEIVVAQEDVDAGVDRTYPIRGTSSHDHDITVTAADFATLAEQGSLTITSTTGGGHTHDVTLSC